MVFECPLEAFMLLQHHDTDRLIDGMFDADEKAYAAFPVCERGWGDSNLSSSAQLIIMQL